MARPKPKAKAKKPLGRRAAAKKRASRSVFRSTLMIGTVMVLLALALPTALLLFVGFVPTLVALMVDDTPRRYAARTVLGLNFAGVAPYIVKLWSGQNDIAAAGRIITDPFALVVMLGAAAIGWMMFLGFPGLVTSVSTMNAHRRIAQLKERQRALIEEWGAAVASHEKQESEPSSAAAQAADPALRESKAA